MRLLRVELKRFRARRAIALMVVLGTLLAGLMVAVTAWDTRPVTEADYAAAKATAAQEAQQPHIQDALAACEENPQAYGGEGFTAAQCESMILPQPEWYLYRGELSLDLVRQDAGLAVLMLMTGLMILVGTTFAGADWASGSMSNQLLFEPRRARIWLSKAAAVFVGALVVTAVIASAFWVSMYLIAEARDIATGASVQREIRWSIARGSFLAAAGGVGGYALTMLLRHTVGTIGALFAYAVVGETLLALLPVEGIGRFSLANNVMAWLRNGTSYWEEKPCPSGGGVCPTETLMTLNQGAVFLSILLSVVLVLSVLSFRRRDIA